MISNWIIDEHKEQFKGYKSHKAVYGVFLRQVL
jgi:hypothetical protein